MTVILSSTDKIIDLSDGVKARVWIGKTSGNVEVVALMTNLAVNNKNQILGEEIKHFNDIHLVNYDEMINEFNDLADVSAKNE